MANDVSNNISEIDVIDQTEFEKGNVIVIDRGTSIEEFNEVVGIDPLLLKNPLRFNHTKFAPVEILVAKECCPQFNLSSDFTDAFADLNEVSGTSTIDGTLCWNEFNSFKPLPSTYILTFGVNDFSEGSILLSVKHNILPSNNSIRFVDENGTCWYGKLETTTAYNILYKVFDADSTPTPTPTKTSTPTPVVTPTPTPTETPTLTPPIPPTFVPEPPPTDPTPSSEFIECCDGLQYVESSTIRNNSGVYLNDSTK